MPDAEHKPPATPRARMTPRLWLVLFGIAIAALWFLVFRCTGLLWWNASEPYESRPKPPPPLFTPLPTFEGVDPTIQKLEKPPPGAPKASLPRGQVPEGGK